MKALVLVEYENTEISRSSLNCISAAKQICQDITLLVVGSNAEQILPTLQKIKMIKKILINNHSNYDHGMAENIAQLIADIGPAHSHLLAAASTFGKNILPRVAALLDTNQISEVIEIVDEQTFKRPIYAGNAIETVKSEDLIKVITIRPSAFSAAEYLDQPDQSLCIERITQRFDFPASRYINCHLSHSTRPDLTSARVIVSGGRALMSADNFKNLLEPLADKLNAAIGATRAAVDAGFTDNNFQVGQTGKIVAPDIYIAIGVSGAIQHLAGMKDSKVIIAINKDPDAEIMKIADYSLQADLFEVIPELIKKL